MLEVKDRFLNFPIALLQGFTDDHMKCLSDIFDYAVYTLVYSEVRVFESIDEFIENYEFNLDEKCLPKLIERGGELFNSFYGMKHVWTGIHINTWENYYKKERKIADLMVLLAFLAFKSIIQAKKPWIRINEDYLLARMAGYESVKKKKPIPEFIQEFMGSESKKRRLYKELESHTSFKRKPGSQRGIIYSVTLSRADLDFEYRKYMHLKSNKIDEERKADKKKADEKFKQWLKDNNGIQEKQKPKDQQKPQDSNDPEDNSKPPT